MKKGTVSKLIALAMTIACIFSFASVANADDTDAYTLSGTAHIQYAGNTQGTFKDGILTLGSRGQSRRVEGFTINLTNNTGYSGTLQYRAYIQKNGWTGWIDAGNFIGTSGECKRIEAVQMRLTGELASYYDVSYIAHIQSYGDKQGWVKNGVVAGTVGENKRLEEIKVKLSAKSAASTEAYVAYRGQVQNEGWEVSWKTNGQQSGTVGKSQRYETVEIVAGATGMTGGITYRSHVQNIGWQGWVSDGAISGTVGQSKRLEAIQIKLTGDLANSYDVYYRVHVQGIGWMGWAKNGESAGTAAFAKRIESIQIVLQAKGSSAPGNVDGVKSADGKSFRDGNNIDDVMLLSGFSGSAHMQTLGTRNGTVTDNVLTLGSRGKSLRVEGITVNFANSSGYSGNLQYSVYIQNKGWSSWTNAGNYAGTTGKSLRIEAIRMRFTGDLASQFDVSYSAHIQDYGDTQGWKSNGYVAGTVGLGKRLEEIKVKITKKTSTSGAYVSCNGQVQNEGWGFAWKDNGTVVGTTGKSRRLEAVTIVAGATGCTGGIRYRAYLQDSGWQGWKSDGNIAGTVGASKRIEALKIQLTGDMASKYDVYYRTYIQGTGWLAWAKNGADSGSIGKSKRIEALQVTLVAKGGSAPGNLKGIKSVKSYAFEDGRDDMTKKAQGYSSSTKYLILADVTKCYVGVYKGEKGAWELVHYSQCSPGKPSTPTVTGTFKVKSKSSYFISGTAYCHYATNFTPHYYFHSVLYDKNGNLTDGRLGVQISHGCIRMAKDDAYYIYKTVPVGSTVVVYK